MRTNIVFFCSFLLCTVFWAQNMDAQNRSITLKVLDKKGRPARNIVVQSIATNKGGVTNRSGLYVFEDMSDNDTISVILTRNGHVVIPVAGMDSIVVKAVSSKLYSYIDQHGANATVKIDRPLASDDNTILDVPAMLRQRSYSSLVDLLSGQVSGVNIATNQTNQEGTIAPMRGPTSIQSGSQPIVVMDGNPLGSLDTANSMVNIYSIKTIEIQKNASGYGVRGANGVIVITSL